MDIASDCLSFSMNASSARSGRSFGDTSLAAIFVGAFVFAAGLLLVPLSVLGGAHIAAVGLSLSLAGLFNTPWAGRRFGLSEADLRTLSVSFLALATILAIAFVVINGFGGVETGEATGGGPAAIRPA
ncbi:MAG: hypothetical protein ACI9YT_000263 [Halobacteriales archaeon]|jgi:hypothetical protein